MPDPENDLGALLRAWRDRCSPVDVGLPAHGRRRARGLRREELAGLAGVSVDYLVRLEQGRSRRPSPSVTAALARALQLDEQESAVLYRAAGLPVPTGQTVPVHVPPGVQRLVTRMDEYPVAVYAADWTLITWNALWSALSGDPGADPSGERNLISATFCKAPAWATMHGTDEALERALVSDLRHAVTTYPNDEDLRALVAQVCETSPRFRDLWASGVAGQHFSSRKTMHHRLVGELVLDCDVLTVPGSDLKITVYTAAAGGPDAERLQFLRVGALNALPGNAVPTVVESTGSP
ncbi:helix-turn-helix transcriptional regulator [Kineosporia babensis]|uniref:Helix-turn-helix transcriptional regulator n=1 Tax=Kineosporia babensis TaxID=499548 RepID=A0A9X1SYJ1_9ACTN|nr:helix-turn-helix transcriptional regulator [Kineosporia babensis]MCD5311038.1 helix-turn-helix transcriptional regulator [Kineosporia babensis]